MLGGFGALATSSAPLASREDIRAFYAGLFAGAPDASVLLVRGARHFAAQDRPDIVAAAIEGFVAGLKPGRRSQARAVAPE